MTAADYQAIASDAEQATLHVQAATEQVRARAFDYDAPLPPLRIVPREQIWEPAARRYRDLTEEEKATK